MHPPPLTTVHQKVGNLPFHRFPAASEKMQMPVQMAAQMLAQTGEGVVTLDFPRLLPHCYKRRAQMCSPPNRGFAGMEPANWR
jgi:hypothetical protein